MVKGRGFTYIMKWSRDAYIQDLGVDLLENFKKITNFLEGDLKTANVLKFQENSHS